MQNKVHRLHIAQTVNRNFKFYSASLGSVISSLMLGTTPPRFCNSEGYFVNLAHGLKPMATLKIEINGKEYEESSSGDGQYDAFVRALRKIYKVTLGRKFPMLTNYAVSIPPGGRTDAFVQTVITWNYDEQVFRTRGLDADQTEAAIKATMKMLNLLEE